MSDGELESAHKSDDIQIVNLDVPSPIPLTSAFLLYRFGVLLAANDIAHRLWHTLLVADAYEGGIVKQLLRHS